MLYSKLPVGQEKSIDFSQLQENKKWTAEFVNIWMIMGTNWIGPSL